VGHFARDANFTPEPFQQSRIVRCLFRQKFQCHRLSECEVVSTIDFPHPALPKQSNDAIATRQQRSGQKPARVKQGAG
jgi:hypothetical protein